MSASYCGFADWPACTQLANTGTDTGALITAAIFALALIVLGVAFLMKGRP